MVEIVRRKPNVIIIANKEGDFILTINNICSALCGILFFFFLLNLKY
jgi:hypothetical protein